jgi:hypothetical protein
MSCLGFFSQFSQFSLFSHQAMMEQSRIKHRIGGQSFPWAQMVVLHGIWKEEVD